MNYESQFYQKDEAFIGEKQRGIKYTPANEITPSYFRAQIVLPGDEEKPKFPFEINLDNFLEEMGNRGFVLKDKDDSYNIGTRWKFDNDHLILNGEIDDLVKNGYHNLICRVDSSFQSVEISVDQAVAKQFTPFQIFKISYRVMDGFLKTVENKDNYNKEKI